MKSFLSTVLIVSLLITTSCAALFNGKRGKIQVNSDPVGASIYVDGTYKGETPKKLKLDASLNHVIKLQYQGQELSYEIESKLGAGWIVLDVLGGVIPVVIDAATGSWYSLKPKVVHGEFKTAPVEADAPATIGQ